MIKDLLKKELIVTDLTASSKDEALGIISEKISQFSGMDKNILKDAFIKREELDSTGFGNGIAIPHAKLYNLMQAFICIFKFKEGVDWDAIDDQPVKVAITFVMPNTAGDNTHLTMLSNFSRKLMNEDFTNGLYEKNDIEDLYNFVIKEMEG